VASETTTRPARPAATPPEFSLSLVGTVIKSRYRVNAVSSVSREAVVYGAEDLHHGRSIALKVLRDEFARDGEFVAAVRERARALASSAHVLRGVQRVYECGVTETGQLFVALEWVEGATLREVLEAGGALAAPTALRVAIRVGEALEALHHNRLVHGQLGPDSVIMVADGERIRLSGAELAAAYRTPIGLRLRDAFSQSYRAPEQIERGEATEATDVYALGMLLRQLLTEGKADQVAGAVAAMPPLSPGIQRIIATALDPRPAHRFPDISVMVNDIWGVTAVVTEPPSRPRAAKARGNPRRRVRRRRGLFALRMTAAVVVATGITVGIVWVAGIDQIVAQLYSRVTPAAVTAVPVERSLLPPSSVVSPASATREPTSTPPQSSAVDDRPTPEPGAPVAVRPPSSVVSPASATREPTSTPPQSSAVDDRPTPEPAAPVAVRQSPIVPAPVDGRPRTIAEPGARAATRAPVASQTSLEPRTPFESRTSLEPRTRAESRPSSESRAAIESSAPIERRASREQPIRPERSDADTTDGSAAIDWLLKDRR
jgi:Protein kinase domain